MSRAWRGSVSSNCKHWGGRGGGSLSQPAFIQTMWGPTFTAPALAPAAPLLGCWSG